MKALLGCVGVSVLASIAQADRFPRIRRQDSNETETESYFHNYAYHNSIVLSTDDGDYLYKVGGVRSTWNGSGDGTLSSDDFNTFAETATYALFLGESFTADTANWSKIEDGGQPAPFKAALWETADGKSFYSYNGGAFESEDADDSNYLWEFTPSGSDGSWDLAAQSPQSNFTELERTQRGLCAGGNGLGFCLGGEQDKFTDSTIDDDTENQIPGLIMYNDTSSGWYNLSATGYTNSGNGKNGAAHWMPDYGPEGLFLVFGGYGENEALVSYDEVFMFEPTTQQWRSQQVTGEPPYPANYPCVTGLRGDNGTYEIFLYGGRTLDIATTIRQAAVYSLTLPAFHWQRHAVVESEWGRFTHACNVAGNRHMLVTGGRIMSTDLELYDPEPWEDGLGIFDLTELEWSLTFDHNAAPYVTGDVIKEYYRANGSVPSKWSDPLISDWFDPTIARTSTTDSEASPSSSSNPGQDSGSSGTNVGAIAGGVVGGVVVIAIVGAVIFFMRRRKRKEAQKAASQDRSDGWHTAPKVEPDTYAGSQPGYLAEMPAERERQELLGQGVQQDRHKPPEQRDLYEM